MLFHLWILSVACFNPITAKGLFKTTKKWSFLEYQFDSEEQREEIMNNLDNEYQISVPTIFDVNVGTDNKTYLTVPRNKGIPATLVKVSSIISIGGPLLEPYPPWKRHNSNGKCDENIINAFYMTVDDCNRTWIMDTGSIDGVQICPPSLLLYNLARRKIIKLWELPIGNEHEHFIDDGLIAAFAVETEPGNCRKFHIYMGNTATNQLVIFNGSNFWTDNSLKYEYRNGHGKLSIAGENFPLDWGIGGFALSPLNSNKKRKLFFRFVTSRDILSVPTSQLQDSWKHGKLMDYDIAKNVLPSPAISMTFSMDGILFFGLTEQLAIGCWNMNNNLTAKNIKILDDDPQAYQFISGIKVIPKEINGIEDQLWIVSNRYQKYILNNRNISEINFRIMTAGLDKLNRQCRSSFHDYSRSHHE